MAIYSQFYNRPVRAVPGSNPMKPPAPAIPQAKKQSPTDSPDGKTAKPGPLPVAPVLDESSVYSGEIGKDEPLLSLDNENILKGFIFSEILAKPKSKRTGR